MAPALLLLKSGASNFFGWFLKYPREMVILVMGIYIVFCQLTHNGPINVNGPCPEGNNGDTISDVTVETFTFDSSKVELDVPEPIPVSTDSSETITWERPVLDIDTAATCADSLVELVSSLRWYDFSLTDCEKRLNELLVINTYRDSARNDSMVVGYEFKVRGELIGTPDLWYKRTAPYVSTTRTITKLEVRGPYRKIGIGVELGYINQGTSFNPGGLETTLQASYTDKKNHQFIIKGGYIFQQQEGWTVGIGYIRNFNIKL